MAHPASNLRRVYLARDLNPVRAHDACEQVIEAKWCVDPEPAGVVAEGDCGRRGRPGVDSVTHGRIGTNGVTETMSVPEVDACLVLHVQCDAKVSQNHTDMIARRPLRIFRKIRIEVDQIVVGDAVVEKFAVLEVPDRLRNAPGTEVAVSQA